MRKRKRLRDYFNGEHRGAKTRNEKVTAAQVMRRAQDRWRHDVLRRFLPPPKPTAPAFDA